MISVNKIQKEGIIFRISDYKDQATKIQFLTEKGIESLIVRGGKKYSKLNSLNQMFTYCHFVSTDGKVLNTLTDGEVIDNYLNIKTDEIKSLIAFSLFEYIQRFNEAINEYSKLFKFMIDLLKILNDTKYPNLILTIFEIKFWYILGIQPRFDQCSKCENVGKYFSIASGGVVCEEHLDEYSLSENFTKTIYLFYHIKLNLIDDFFLEKFDSSFKDLEKIISDYYQYYFEFTNQNKKLLLSFLK